MFRDVDIAIARTRAAYDDLPEVREIETLYIDMICAAKRFIYFENQYFTSAKIGAAIADAHGGARPARNRHGHAAHAPTAGWSRRRWTARG